MIINEVGFILLSYLPQHKLTALCIHNSLTKDADLLFTVCNMACALQ